MKTVFIINGHMPSPYEKGRLNRTLVDIADRCFQEKGYTVLHTAMGDDYDVSDELEKHQKADVILLQTPVHWMGLPWGTKKYIDEIYSAGMSGQFSDGDGRTRKDSSRHYGSGGTLVGKQYMLSLTFNAPKEAFQDPAQYLFQGKSVDDLFFPTHMNFRFFGMTPLETFVCYDVLKNPDIEADFKRFRAHLDQI